MQQMDTLLSDSQAPAADDCGQEGDNNAVDWEAENKRLLRKLHAVIQQRDWFWLSSCTTRCLAVARFLAFCRCQATCRGMRMCPMPHDASLALMQLLSTTAACVHRLHAGWGPTEDLVCSCVAVPPLPTQTRCRLLHTEVGESNIESMRSASCMWCIMLPYLWQLLCVFVPSTNWPLMCAQLSCRRRPLDLLKPQHPATNYVSSNLEVLTVPVRTWVPSIATWGCHLVVQLCGCATGSNANWMQIAV